jgi:hypothetical protein
LTVPVVEVPEAAPEPAPAPVAAPVAAPVEQQPSRPFPAGVEVLWVVVAVVVGVGLRFLKLPDYVIPILIGVGVGAAVVLAARYLMAQEEKKTATPEPAPAPPRKPATPTARLGEMQRRAKRPARGGVREN